VWHVADPLLRVVDRRNNRAREFLEQVGETIFLWSGFASVCSTLCLCSDAAIRVKAAESTIAFLEDTAAFLDERFDVIDKLLLIKLVSGSSVGFFNVLP
jgi:hypothetical protein